VVVAEVAEVAEEDVEEKAQLPPREELEALLVEHAGNVTLLAEHYGRHRKQIYRWLRRHGLEADRYRRG
jgi:transcriptional regulator of acetoin/glycerol metabolism